MQIYLPDQELIIVVHDNVIEISGGKAGILNPNAIIAAVDRPRTYSSYHYEFDIHTVCALLIDSLARNHAFVEGNKRTALLTMLFTYELNDILFDFNDDMQNDFEETVLWVVIDKPSIEQIEKRLRILVEKYGNSGTRAGLKNLKKFIKPYKNE